MEQYLVHATQQNTTVQFQLLKTSRRIGSFHTSSRGSSRPRIQKRLLYSSADCAVSPDLIHREACRGCHTSFSSTKSFVGKGRWLRLLRLASSC